jgi:hypothetical protein
MTGMDTEFERRITWDAESLGQLVVLNPQARPSAYRALIERGQAKLSEALREAVDEKARRG